MDSQLKEYRKRMREKYNQLKEKEKEEENKRRQEDELEKKKLEKLRFVEEQRIFWSKEGYDEKEVDIIVSHLVYNKEKLESDLPILPVDSLSKSTCPDYFEAVVQLIDGSYALTDLRTLFGISGTILYEDSNIPDTHLFPLPEEWTRLGVVWDVVNPYKKLSYLTKEYNFKVKSLTTEETSLKPSQLVNKYIFTYFQPSPYLTKYEKEQIYGAQSVVLPRDVVKKLLKVMVEHNVLTNKAPAIVVEICSEKTSTPRHVYAYCQNPDVHSRINTIQIPFLLRAVLGVNINDYVRVRFLVPPSPCEPPKRAVKLMPIVDVPKDVSDEVTLREALRETLTHQRVISPGQVVLAYVTGSLEFGPIPFLVAQTYGENNRPIALISVVGHGEGIDCGIEIMTNPDLVRSDSRLTGKDAVINYVQNLVQNIQNVNK